MYKKRGKFKKKKLIVLSSTILFFLLSWLFLSFSVNPILKKISEEKIKTLTNVAINEAVEKIVVESGATYDQLVKIDKDSQGEIQLLQVNSYLINVISRQISILSQENISNLGSQGINIPLGSISGITFLAGKGPDIKIKVFPIGSTSISFDSTFFQAGINQTKHRIDLLISAEISIIMPGLNKTVVTQTPVALCETIIVGKIPDIYFNANSLNEMLNLVA